MKIYIVVKSFKYHLVEAEAVKETPKMYIINEASQQCLLGDTKIYISRIHKDSHEYIVFENLWNALDGIIKLAYERIDILYKEVDGLWDLAIEAEDMQGDCL